MKEMTISAAAQACGGRLSCQPDEDRGLGKVAIDSRAVEPGDMFAAYRGEKQDGHDYIKKAFENGAACCLANHVPPGVEGPVILVEDVQSALEDICAKYREGLTLPLIGVTGSVGKTTAKEMAASVLAQRWNVLKTDKNLNNQIGVPMTISRIERQHQAAVVELGISDFGEMSRLSRIARPTVALFTVIGHAHLEYLHDLEGVFRAKTELLRYMRPEDTVIINGDDPYLKRLRCPQRRLSYGLGADCDVRAVDISAGSDHHSRCTLLWEDRRIPVEIPAYGRHMVYAALEGAALGFLMGMEDEEIARGIMSYEIVGRRGSVVDTGFITLIDDSYNANPDSVASGIDSLAQLTGRKLCILGDMLEMGHDSARLHFDTGKRAREKGIDLVLCCGELSRETCRGTAGAGLWFESVEELISALPELIRPSDTVLVKASRGMRFERIAEALKDLR